MAYAEPIKPKLLLAATGCLSATKFEKLCRGFCEWAEVIAVVTEAALHFLNVKSLPQEVNVFSDASDWSTWRKLGDKVLHIELSKWADIMVIAPLSANTLAKIAEGLCDNLLTCIVRAWDYRKPLVVAPDVNISTWRNLFTEKHLMSVEELGVIVIPHETGGMVKPSQIVEETGVIFETAKSRASSSK